MRLECRRVRSDLIVFITPPGGFFVFGSLMALVIWIEEKAGQRIERRSGCE